MPIIAKVLPISFFHYKSDNELKLLNKQDSTIHKYRYASYSNYKAKIGNSLALTKLTKEEMETLSKAWHFRQERATLGLTYQIELKEQGKKLLKLIEQKYK